MDSLALKVLEWKSEFWEKNNQKLSKFTVPVAIDKDEIYFVNGLLEWKNEYENTGKHFLIDLAKAIDKNGKDVTIKEGIVGIDTSALYKMNLKEFIDKLSDSNWDDRPYLGLADSIKLADYVTKLVNDESSKLIVLKKKNDTCKINMQENE
ncbi:hypothetical protein [Mycoplasmopsis agalactiae]|uniref:CDSB n=1 Tax=Mycoplasmopsis agalactiae TaxID=2110 RepID=D3VQC3_MYCAA|nr:hypothetical protein [Mycoplasmopsis agalactiae]KAB6718636.1 hypothetical protein E4L58_01890 [Mycoplasmopsis agalactiae]CAJ32607.1 CDSB [Mycoplasmopsis agalactiae]CBH40517.1 CDSB [Mycoplasmopsis agalactiae]CBH40699.1 CDSB [Mycoplasmopsis agalactiae]CBH40909.1 CDSB [Mycoplasmopsis agalactiae]